MSDQLRFGVICDQPRWRQWEARCVKEILNSGAATLELIVHVEQPARGVGPDSGRSEKAPSRVARYLRKHLSGCDAFKPLHAPEVFGPTPVITFEEPGRRQVGQTFPQGFLDKVGGLGLHFLLGFTRADIPAEVAGSAQYGIWVFPHDYLERRSGGLPFVPELLRGEDTVGIVLAALTANSDTVLLLREGRLKIHKHSYRETVDSIYSQCAKWPAWACKKLLNCGPAAMPSVRRSSQTFAIQPSNEGVSWRDAATMIRRAMSHKWNSLFRHGQWNIGIAPVPITRLLRGGRISNVTYLEITEGRERFRADPFALEKDGVLTILYEDFDYRTGKGTIRCGRLIGGDRLSHVRQVFDMPFHMSYPYLFLSDGQIYCLPESGHGRRARLYRAVQFPETWAKVSDLVENTAATDATVFRYQGRWWVTFTDRDHDPDVNLFLAYSDRLEGPWLPHAANPVKTDVRSARPAGTPFFHEGKLYRPAQDCSDRYGARTVINLVHALTPTEFREEPAAVVEPPENGPFSEGLHTLCSVGDITIVDGYRTLFIGAVLKQTLIRRTKRAWNALIAADRRDDGSQGASDTNAHSKK